MKELNNSIYSAASLGFLGFIDVEFIRFFHGALQLCVVVNDAVHTLIQCAVCMASGSD